MGNNIAVSITADVADLSVKRAILSSELKAATKDLNDFANQARTGGMTTELRAGMVESAQAATKLKAEVAGVTAEIKVMGAESVSGFARLREGIAETAETVQGFKESLLGIGEAMIAFFAVEQLVEFARKMAEGAEQVQHTATTFGLAATEVQRLQALASGAGVPFEALTTAMQRSDKALTTAREGSKTAGEAFKALGINIHEPIGQVQLIQEELAGLANVQDIPTRIGLAMQLFGRNIQQIAPLISVTKEQIDTIAQATTAYGAVNADAQQKGMALAESFNTNKIAMQGLGNTLIQALAPSLTLIVDGVNEMIKGFIESYNQGGIVKVALDALAISLKTIVAALSLAGAAFTAAFSLAKASVEFFLASWRTAVDYFVDSTKQMEDMAVTLGKVIYDGLTHNVLQAAQDMKAGWATMEADSKKTAADFAANFAAAGKAAAASVNEAMSAISGSVAFGVGLFGTPQDTKNFFGLPNGQNPQGAGGGAPPNLGGGRKGGKGQDPTQAAIQADTDQWQHFADWVVVITGKANTDMLQAEIDFWSKKLNAAKQGSDLWFAVLEKLNPLVAQQEEEQTRIAKKAADDRIKAVDQETNATINSVLRRYGEEQHIAIETQEILDRYGKKAAEDYERNWDKSVGAVTRDFARGLLQMAEGTTSFGQVMANIGNKIAEMWVDHIATMVSDWAKGMAQHVITTNVTNAAITASNQAGANANLIITLETNLKKIVSDAKAAAASAYNWAAAWGGPIAGAIAGAAAFVGVMAFSAKEGWGDVPFDGAMTQLHAHEMVLPASIANPVRDMAESYNGSGGGGGGPWGDTHNHYHLSPTVNAIDGSSVRQFFSTHGQTMMDELHARARNGREPRWAVSSR